LGLGLGDAHLELTRSLGKLPDLDRVVNGLPISQQDQGAWIGTADILDVPALDVGDGGGCRDVWDAESPAGDRVVQETDGGDRWRLLRRRCRRGACYHKRFVTGGHLGFEAESVANDFEGMGMG